MVNIVKLLRSATLGNRPTGAALVAGAPYVNFADKQFGVVDSTPAAQDLIGVPFFSASANYSAGQPVNYLGQLYVARGTVTAGAWNAASWAPVTASNTAAPFDALAYNGMQINGGMDVFQIGTAALSNAQYAADGWYMSQVGTSVLSLSQYAPGVYFPLFTNCLVLFPSTAQVTMGAGDLVAVVQGIEGYRIARLGWGTVNAQPLTIGFWTAHHRTGTYSVSIRNGALNRSYATTYVHNVADTAQYNVITIPGDTAGTWAIDNTRGMTISFAVAIGTTYTAPAANTWYGVQYIAAPGQINGVAATTDNFRITGVVVLPGIEAPSAARSPFIMRPYDQELPTCWRYFQSPQTSANYSLAGYTPAATVARIGVVYRHVMRAAPTLLTPGVASVLVSSTGVNNTATGIAFTATSGIGGAGLDVTCSGAAFTPGQGCLAGFPPGSIFFDARL